MHSPLLPFTSSTHNHPFFLHKHSFFIQRHAGPVYPSGILIFPKQISHWALFSHRPSIPFVTSFWSSHLSHQILLFPSPTNPPPLSPCTKPPQHTLLCSTTQLSRNTRVLLCTFSFLTRSIRVTPHILLRTPISITFIIFSAADILHDSAPIKWSQLLLHITFSLHPFPFLYNYTSSSFFPTFFLHHWS